MELEELKSSIEEYVKQKKDYQLSFSVLENQLNNGKLILGRTENMIAELEKRRANLADEVVKERADLVRRLEEREAKLSKSEEALAFGETALRGQKNEFNAQLLSLQKAQEENAALKAVLDSKFEKIADFLGHAKEMLETFK